MGSMSIVHWLIVLFVVVLLFGPRRLPELAKGMGEAIREFKKAMNTPEAPKPTQIASDVKPQIAAEVKTPAEHVETKRS